MKQTVSHSVVRKRFCVLILEGLKMKYTRAQFTTDYYQLWQVGLLLPIPQWARVYSVKYRKNQFDVYSRVTLKAVSVSDALERACYAITHASPWRPEDIDLHAVYDEDENLLWIDEPYYDLVQKKHEFRGMERREFLLRFGATSAAILFGLQPMLAKAGTTTTALSGTASGFGVVGEQLYTTAGSYSWTVPSGVTSACVVCVGGGGGGGASNPGSGGGAGGLCWKNSIAVTAGNSYSVSVGAGGTGANGSTNPSNGGNSSLTVGATVPTANGGGGGRIGVQWTGNTGGSFSGGDGGGAGGMGGYYNATSGGYGGGGGAGGYSGSGGQGGDAVAATNGSGGGGAGGSQGSGGGGGVGLYGQGANGAISGGGGSGGTAGGTSHPNYYGGNYGGAGGSVHALNANGTNNGGSGAVRILWGTGRSFPSNAT